MDRHYRNGTDGLSWRAVLCCVVAGSLAVPAGILAVIYLGLVGCILALTIPILFGKAIARISRRDLHSVVYALIVAIVGPLPMLAASALLMPSGARTNIESAMTGAFALLAAIVMWVGIMATIAVQQTWTRFRGRRRAKGICRCCAYDLTGNISGVCPECGTPIRWR